MLHAVEDAACAEDLSKWCRYHEEGRRAMIENEKWHITQLNLLDEKWNHNLYDAVGDTYVFSHRRLLLSDDNPSMYFKSDNVDTEVHRILVRKRTSFRRVGILRVCVQETLMDNFANAAPRGDDGLHGFRLLPSEAPPYTKQFTCSVSIQQVACTTLSPSNSPESPESSEMTRSAQFDSFDDLDPARTQARREP
jgi:hypothetical protein